MTNLQNNSNRIRIIPGSANFRDVRYAPQGRLPGLQSGECLTDADTPNSPAKYPPGGPEEQVKRYRGFPEKRVPPPSRERPSQ